MKRLPSPIKQPNPKRKHNALPLELEQYCWSFINDEHMIQFVHQSKNMENLNIVKYIYENGCPYDLLLMESNNILLIIFLQQPYKNKKTRIFYSANIQPT